MQYMDRHSNAGPAETNKSNGSDDNVNVISMVRLGNKR